MKKVYKGRERRQFVRFDYLVPLAYKVCKEQTVSKLLQGYTTNISEAGLLCNIKDKVKKNDTLWLSFDRGALSICEKLEARTVIYQNGVLGKVVRIERKKDSTYDVGVQLITREEKNLTHIYPKIHFLKDQTEYQVEPEEEVEEVEEEREIEEEKQGAEEEQWPDEQNEQA